jgi:hypothetical protein
MPGYSTSSATALSRSQLIVLTSTKLWVSGETKVALEQVKNSQEDAASAAFILPKAAKLFVAV